MTFAEKLKVHTDRLGVKHAAHVCGVHHRTVYVWMNGKNEPCIATQVGALLLLSKEKKPS